MAPRGTRQNTVSATWSPAGQARREDRGQGQRRRQEAVPAEGHRPRGWARCAPRSMRAAARARGGLARVSAVSAETGRDRAHATPLPVAAIAAPPCSRRSRRLPCADPSPAPVMTLGGRPLEAPARSTVSFPAAPPCMTRRHSRPEPRKDTERRAGIRNLHPFRIPALPGAVIARSGFSRGGRGHGTLRPAIPLGSGMRCRVDSHSRLWRKLQRMLEFLSALTSPGIPSSREWVVMSLRTAGRGYGPATAERHARGRRRRLRDRDRSQGRRR